MSETQKWIGVFALGLTLCIVTIDFYGVTVAIPKIGEEFQVVTSTMEWILNAFALGLAAPLIAIGRLADHVGRRKIVLWGTFLFAVGSVICGISNGIELLITGRAIQGVSSAMLFGTSLSIISHMFDDIVSKIKAIAIWSAVGTIGNSIGPFVGGVFVDYIGWRWFFFINLPIALIGYILILANVKESKDETISGRLDYIGFFTITLSSVLFILALQLSDKFGFASKEFIYNMVFAFILFGLFYYIQQRKLNPLIEFSLFNDRNFLVCSLIAIIGNGGWSAYSFFTAIYTQFVLGFSAFNSGMILLGYTVTFTVACIAVKHLVQKYSERHVMAIGMMITTLAFFIFCFISPMHSRSYNVIILLIALVLGGIGLAFSYTISSSSAMKSLPREKSGMAAGVISSIRMFGMVLGIALSGIIYKYSEINRFNELLQEDIHSRIIDYRTVILGLIEGLKSAMTRIKSLPPDIAKEIFSIYQNAAAHGFKAIMVFWLIFSALAIYIALKLRNESEIKRG